MSSTTKKKHVTKECLEEYPLPEGKREVVKVVASRGNNLHEVQTCTGEKYLATMPCKFRKHIWIKRGDFILVEPIEEGDKVKAEISHILFKDQIKHIQEQDMWPKEFSEKESAPDKGGIPNDMLPPSDSEDSGDEELRDMCINVNRVTIQEQESETDSEEEEDNNDDDDDDDDEGIDIKKHSTNKDTNNSADAT